MELKQRHGHLLMDYWRGLHNAGRLPGTGELDADILKILLPNTMVIDYCNADRMNVRLAGRDAHNRFGVGTPDWNFLASFAPLDQLRMAAAFTKAIEKGNSLRLATIASMNSGSWTKFEAVFLPVQGSDADSCHFIAMYLPLAFVEESETIRAQYVVELEEIDIELASRKARSHRDSCVTKKKGLRLVSSRG